MMLEAQRKLATKTAYATLGAPVVATKMAKEYRAKMTKYTEQMATRAEKRFEAAAKEGHKIAKRIQRGTVVEEIQSRVDLEKVQDRVERLRDQLEGALQSWRESFSPGEPKVPATRVPVEKAPVTKAAAVKKPATRTAAVKKPVTKPAVKATAAKTTAARKPATRKPTTTTA